MFKSNTNKSSEETLNKLIDENNQLKKLFKEQLEDSIITINQVQDIQALGNTEREKDIMRNNIINKKRTEYVTKIMELDKVKELVRPLNQN